MGFKNGKIRGKIKLLHCYRKNCSAVDLLFTTVVALHSVLKLK